MSIVGALAAGSLAVLGAVLYLRRARSPKSAATPAPDRASERRHWLVGSAGPVAGKAWFLGERTLTIGRGPENAIQVAGSDVSRIHCQVSAHAGALRVVDMTSKNGTLVNGRAQPVARMVDGDELRVADAGFVFRVQGDFVDAGAARKAADTDSFAQTAQANQKRIEAAVQAQGGDVEAAAAKLGMDPEALRMVLSGSHASKED